MTERRTIILLRGLFRDQFHWGAFVHRLKENFPHHDILCLDIAGNGIRHREMTPETLDEIAKDLHHQFVELRHTGDHSADIIAISMGGMIALRWMALYPNDINKALLINTSTQSLSPFYQRLRWQRYFDLLHILVLPNYKQEEKVIRLTSNRSWSIEELAAITHQWANWKAEHPISCTNMYRQINACRQFSLSKQPQHAIHILASRCDKLVNYQCSLKLAKHWSLPITIHPSAGHDIPLDDPEWVSLQAKYFF
ncbi:alpha/beta fold hydrolase [Photobacterium leiognathi]|uniref:alpha/beta fold hydrolase n=1 Tax=Photobacterium leiognathi TaxID=553611 RepID=UPI003AF35C77